MKFEIRNGVLHFTPHSFSILRRSDDTHRKLVGENCRKNCESEKSFTWTLRIVPPPVRVDSLPFHAMSQLHFLSLYTCAVEVLETISCLEWLEYINWSAPGEGGRISQHFHRSIDLQSYTTGAQGVQWPRPLCFYTLWPDFLLVLKVFLFGTAAAATFATRLSAEVISAFIFSTWPPRQVLCEKFATQSPNSREFGEVC